MGDFGPNFAERVGTSLRCDGGGRSGYAADSTARHARWWRARRAGGVGGVELVAVCERAASGCATDSADPSPDRSALTFWANSETIFDFREVLVDMLSNTDIMDPSNLIFYDPNVFSNSNAYVF